MDPSSDGCRRICHPFSLSFPTNLSLSLSLHPSLPPSFSHSSLYTPASRECSTAILCYQTMNSNENKKPPRHASRNRPGVGWCPHRQCAPVSLLLNRNTRYFSLFIVPFPLAPLFAVSSLPLIIPHCTIPF